LVGVIALVLVFRQSFENRSMLANYCLRLARITQGQEDYRVTSSEVYDTRTKAMITAENFILKKMLLGTGSKKGIDG